MPATHIGMDQNCAFPSMYRIVHWIPENSQHSWYNFKMRTIFISEIFLHFYLQNTLKIPQAPYVIGVEVNLSK